MFLTTDSASTSMANIIVNNDGSWETQYTRCRHDWVTDSLRGSNCNQRVEHVRCARCGERRTRVWTSGMNARLPDREYKRAA